MANFGDILSNVSLGASESIRRNASDTDFEAFTPGSGASFVTGMIMMWSGTIATIPSGWALCNGSGGTPDLRDKFIVGATADDSGVAKTNLTGSLTASGGAVTHHHADHSVTQPAAHSNHSFTQPTAHSNHVFTQPTGHGTLTHTTGADSTTSGGTAKVVATTHTLTNNHSGGGVDAHSAHSGGSVDAHSAHSGAAVGAHDTLSAPQPYYALAYIMKT